MANQEGYLNLGERISQNENGHAHFEFSNPKLINLLAWRTASDQGKDLGYTAKNSVSATDKSERYDTNVPLPRATKLDTSY